MRMLSAESKNLLATQISEYNHAVAGPATSYLHSRGITDQTIAEFQLGYDGNRLTIPYLTPAGPVGIKRRCIQQHDCKTVGHQKYLLEESADPHLFNAQAFLTATVIVGVEGEIDAMTGEQCGFPHIGIPGSQLWKANRWWRWCFDNAEEIVLVADGDEPLPGKKYGVGEELMRMVRDDLRKCYPDTKVRLVVMPVGHDTNSFVASEGDIAYLEKAGLI